MEKLPASGLPMRGSSEVMKRGICALFGRWLSISRSSRRKPYSLNLLPSLISSDHAGDWSFVVGFDCAAVLVESGSDGGALSTFLAVAASSVVAASSGPTCDGRL